MKKVMLIIGVFIIFVSTGIYAAYKYSIVQTEPTPLLEPTPVISLVQTTSMPTPTKIASNSGDISAITPIHAGTVSFARNEGKVIMRYRGKIYDDTNQTQPIEITVKDSDKLQWYGLVDAPDFVKPGAFMNDEFFGFKPTEDTRKIVFIMRWGKENDTIGYYAYLYDPSKPNAPVTLVKKFTPDASTKYGVPKVSSLSPDDSYAAFDMYSCWNCGGNKPETLLVRFSDLAMSRIGLTSSFTWKTGGEYTYKAYIEKECSEPGPAQCFEDPASLPTKAGTFKAD